MDNDKDIQDAGEQAGRAMKAEANEYTGSVKYNFKQGRLINWNIEKSGWPERKK